MAKSAKRRHHIERLKKKRKKYWGRNFGFMDPLTPKQLNMVARTPKWCGCFMCSSKKRKKLGKTFYVKRQDARAHSELESVMEIEDVKKAVDAFYGDTNREKSQTLDDLFDLQDHLSELICALEEDLESEDVDEEDDLSDEDDSEQD